MFVVTTTGSAHSVSYETRATAIAKARFFSQKYGRTFKVTEVVTEETLVSEGVPSAADLLEYEANVARYDAQVYYCPTCHKHGDEPCVTASGKTARKNHTARTNR